MKAALYLRKSRADDPHEEIAVTLKRHEDTLCQFAQRENFHIVRVYREVVSGDRLDARIQMQQLLADCNKGDFDHVLCMDIDRLGRGSMAEQGLILDTFKAAHITLVTPRKVYDLNNDIDETYSEFESFMARQELKIIKRRLKRGIRCSAEDGSFLSMPPYGYRRMQCNGHPSLAPVPIEAEAVQLIFNWYTRDGLGCQQIAERLQAMGYLPRRAAAFGRTSVLDILSNPVYCGRVVRRDADAETIDTCGLHEPLVSVTQFEQAARIRSTRAHPPLADRTLKNPLAGFVVCGFCGSKLQRLPRNSTRRQESIGCPRAGCNVTSKLSLVENQIVTAVFARVPIAAPAPQKPPQPDHTVARAKQLEEQKARLYQLVEQGVYTPQEYAERRAALEQQQITLAKRSAPPERETSAVITDLESYFRADAAARNRFLRVFLRKVTYEKACGSSPHVFSLSFEWVE